MNNQIGEWRFGKDVVDIFDKHVNQSVPLYGVIQKLIVQLAQFFISADDYVYDIGTSTGTTIQNLKTHINKDFTAIGIDNSQSMIFKAEEKLMNLDKVNLICSDVEKYTFKHKASLIISNLTLQFIPIENRKEVIKKYYGALNVGGALIIVEKVYGDTPRHQDIYTQLYHDYKEEQGLTPEEIRNKDKSLRSVLIPRNNRENVEMLNDAGFVTEEFFKYLNFVGYLAIKQ